MDCCGLAGAMPTGRSRGSPPAAFLPASDATKPDNRLAGPLPRSPSSSSHHLRTSILTAFGRSPSGRRQRNDCVATPASDPSKVIDSMPLTERGGNSAGDNRRWGRRPSVRLSRLAKGVFGNKTKHESEVLPSNKRIFGETKPRSWRTSLPFRRSKSCAGSLTIEDLSSAVEHPEEVFPALSLHEADRSWELGLGGGAAARAAAAAQNESLELGRQLLSKELGRIRDLRLTSDSESGIGIELREQPDELGALESSMIRQDPAMMLPEELFAHILLHLDAHSLMHAERVSRRWYATASSCHIWRNVFVSEYGRAPPPRSKPSTGRVGGLGFGRYDPNQQWKKMWKTRKALEARWARGYAAAIYLEGHQDTVYCVQFDEHKILTGSRDRTIRVWDATTFECLRILGVPKQTVNNAPTMPPLPQRSSKGHQPFDVILPHSSGQRLKYPTAQDTPIYHHGSILCLQFDQELMVTGSSDMTLIMWDTKAGWKPVQRLRQHRAGVLDVCFNALYIVSCSKDTTICLWDRGSGSLLRTLSGHRGPVNAVQLRGELIVSASGDGVAKLWNVTSGLCVKEFPSDDRGLACVEFSPDCRTIFAGGNDQIIYQFDAANGELVRELRGHIHLVRSLHLDHLNGRIVSGSYDKSIKVYNVEDGEMLCDFACWTTSWMLSAKSDYRRIIATSQDKRVVIVDFGYGLQDVELLCASTRTSRQEIRASPDAETQKFESRHQWDASCLGGVPSI